MRISSLVDYSTLKVRVGQHAFLLPIACLTALIHALVHVLVASTAWHAKIGASCGCIHHLTGRIVRALVRLRRLLLLTVNIHLLVAVW